MALPEGLLDGGGNSGVVSQEATAPLFLPGCLAMRLIVFEACVRGEANILLSAKNPSRYAHMCVIRSIIMLRLAEPSLAGLSQAERGF